MSLTEELQWYFYDWQWRQVKPELQEARDEDRLTREEYVEIRDGWREEFLDRRKQIPHLLSTKVSAVYPSKDWGPVIKSSVTAIGGYMYSPRGDRQYVNLGGDLWGGIQGYTKGKYRRRFPDELEDVTDDTVIWICKSFSYGGGTHSQNIMGIGFGVDGWEDALLDNIERSVDFLEGTINKYASFLNVVRRNQ